MTEEFKFKFDSLWEMYEQGDELALVLALSVSLHSKKCPEVLWKELATHYPKEIFDLVNKKQTGKRGPQPRLSTRLIERRRVAAVRAAEILRKGCLLKVNLDEKKTIPIVLPPQEANQFELALKLIELCYGSSSSDADWGSNRTKENRGWLESFYSENADKPEFSLDIAMNRELLDSFILDAAHLLARNKGKSLSLLG